MSQQLEKGTQFPMRPAVCLVSTAALFSGASDATNPADWTTAGTIITPVLSTEFMENSRLQGDYFTASGEDITLLPGIYKIDMTVNFDNSGAGAETFAIAVTNGDATVVHVESEPKATGVPILADQAGTLSLTTLLHVTATSGVNSQVNFRAMNRTTGTEVDIVAGQVAIITKIGNVNET